MNIEELERKQIAESGFANWPRDFAAEQRALQRASDPPPALPDVRDLYPKVYDEYLEGEREYPVTDRWDREAEARHNYEENEPERKARE